MKTKTIKFPVINSFTDEYAFLSNFYESWITDEDVWNYPTVEHYFQCMKTINMIERHKIIFAATPQEAKKLGRKCTLISNWEDIKVQIMYDGLMMKYTQNENLADKLKATGNAYLIEGNCWKDTFWGYDINLKMGKNMLGQLLMDIRKKIK